MIIENLIILVEDETKLYNSLLLVLYDEKSAVEESSLTDLHEANEKKISLTQKIQKLERQRQQELKKFAISMGRPEESFTISNLAEYLGMPYAERLTLCRSNLLSLTQQIIKANNINKLLLNHSIELVRGSLSLLNNLMASGYVYFKTGQLKNSTNSGRVISREV